MQDGPVISEVRTQVLKLSAAAASLGAKRDGSEIGDDYEVHAPWCSLYSSRYETLLVEVVAADGTSGGVRP